MDPIEVLLVEAELESLRVHAQMISTASGMSLVGAGTCLMDGLISRTRGSRIDVLVINVSQPDMNEIATWAVLHALLPGAAIVALLDALDDSGLLMAVAAGALGLHRLGTPKAGLIRCIRRASGGIHDFDKSLLARLKHHMAHAGNSEQGGTEQRTSHGGEVKLTIGRPPLGSLTVRETQVAVLLSRGLPNREIASRLFLSERTVRNCVSQLLAKLGFSNRTQAALWIRESSAHMERIS